MSTIVTRAGKGSPLTNNEVDANFTNLNTDKIQVTGTPTTGQAPIWDGTSWVPGTVVSGVTSVASADGSVTVVNNAGAVDLSVAAANNVVAQVRNATGATLAKGTVVYISGATGQIPTVSKALATSDATSAQTLGMLTADLPNNTNGNVTIIGLITGIDTSAFTDGAQLYLSGTTAGTYTATKPYAPTHLVYVGVVEHAHPTQGKIFVKVQNGYELDEIHNVSAQTPSNGQTIVYNSTTQLWEQSNAPVISGTTIDNTVIGGTTPAAGTFTTLTATGQTSLGGAAGANNFRILDTAGSVNYWNVRGGDGSTTSPRFTTDGTGTNIAGQFASKGTGAFQFLTGGTREQLRVSDTASAVNYVQVTGAATGVGTQISMQGSDATVSGQINTKGAGAFSFYNNGGGNRQLRIDGSVSAVNFLGITGAVTGNSPILSAAGQSSDANVGLVLQSKGTGAIDLAAGSSGVNISNGGTVTAVTVSNAGATAYSSIPSVAITAPTTAGGVQAVATALMRASTGATTLASGGTGYTVGDVLTLVGGTFTTVIQITVNTVSAGVISTFTMSNAGAGYSVLPTNPVAVTGGTGTGATFNVSWFVNTITVGTAGSGYVEQPTVSFSGGGGSGATAYATVGSVTTIKSLGSSTTGSTLSSIQFVTPNNSSPNYPPLTIRDIANSDTGILISPNTGYTQLIANNASSGILMLGSFGTSSVYFNTNGTNQTNQMRVAHTASAVNYVQVTGAATGGRPTISAQGSDSAIAMNINAKGGSIIAFSNNGTSTTFTINNTTSQVNYLQVTGGIAGSAPVMLSQGTDTNIDLALTPKGTGVVKVGSNTVLHAGNYNTYAPTLTGTGASGSWGISVTGSAGSVAWSGVTGTPTTLAGYGITDAYSSSNPSGYITSSALSGYLTSASAASTYLPLAGGTLTGRTSISFSGMSSPSNTAILPTSLFNWTGGGGDYLSLGQYTNSNFWIQAAYQNPSLAYYAIALNPLGGSVTANGNQVLHAGNYTSYSPAYSYFDDYTRGGYRVIADYNGTNTWYIRSSGQFVWGRGHDWSQAFELYLGNGTTGNANGWAEFGQRQSNNTHGTWFGTRFVQYLSNGKVDGKVRASQYYLGDDSNYITGGGSGAIRSQTSYGYVDVGAQNSSYAHIQTDRPQFYFNKTVYVDGDIYKYTGALPYLHSGNYSSYAVPLSGGTMSGRLTISPGWTTDGRNYSNEWIEFGNYSGLYSPQNSAHFYPNNASYGAWRIAGTRNGWGGLQFDATNGAVCLMIYPNSNTTGFHNPSYGWQFQWSDGVLYCNKSTYGGGTQATVLDSSNYSSYALPLSGGTVSGNLYANAEIRLNAANTARIGWRPAGSGTLGLGLPFALNPANGAINIETSDGDTGGLMIDNEGVTVYGAGDTGYVFRVIDEDQYQSNGNSVANATQFWVGQDSGTAGFRNQLTIAGNTALHAGNYTSYSPSLGGSGASGTWGINITGNASTVGSKSSTAFHQRAHFGTQDGRSSGYYKVRILPATSWMLTFVVRIYQGYESYDIRICGYNYGGNYWYSPQASLMDASGSAIDVRFGYDSAYNLWVAFPASNYTGLDVVSVVNGYTQFDGNYADQFAIGYESSLSGTVQTVVTTYRPVKLNEALTTSNYTSYSPSLGGSGASGTWSINVTGSAGSADRSNYATRLHRRDDSSDYNVQTYWTGSYWRLYGYYIDSGHADVQVGYANDAGNASSAARASRANGNFYIDDNYGNGVVGVYSSYRYQGIFAMGDSYKLPADGTSTGSLYGACWSHPNAGGTAGNLSSHGMLLLQGGGFMCALSTSIVASANVTAYSDERLKTNWQPMPENYVARLAQVKVGIYDRTDQEDITQVGVSAQSLQQLLPQAIMTAEDEMQTLSVNYGGAALASAVELAKEVVDLRSRVAHLESLISKLIGD